MAGKMAERVRAKLQVIFKDAYNAETVKIGWAPDAIYDNGQQMAAVAALNEFGGTIRVKKATQTIYRKIDERTGAFLRDGRFVKPKQSNYMTTHPVAEGGYNVTIPPRPFFRPLVAANHAAWGEKLNEAMHATRFNAEKSLKMVGLEVEGELRQAMRDLKSPANAKSTIRKKGFDDPLVDSGQMIASTSVNVK